MRNRKKRESLISKLCSKFFNWAAGMLMEAIPVIGPIYKVVSIVNDVHAVTVTGRRRRRAYAAA